MEPPAGPLGAPLVQPVSDPRQHDGHSVPYDPQRHFPVLLARVVDFGNRIRHRVGVKGRSYKPEDNLRSVRAEPRALGLWFEQWAAAQSTGAGMLISPARNR